MNLILHYLLLGRSAVGIQCASGWLYLLQRRLSVFRVDVLVFCLNVFLHYILCFIFRYLPFLDLWTLRVLHVRWLVGTEEGLRESWLRACLSKCWLVVAKVNRVFVLRVVQWQRASHLVRIITILLLFQVRTAWKFFYFLQFLRYVSRFFSMSPVGDVTQCTITSLFPLRIASWILLHILSLGRVQGLRLIEMTNLVRLWGHWLRSNVILTSGALSRILGRLSGIFLIACEILSSWRSIIFGRDILRELILHVVVGIGPCGVSIPHELEVVGLQLCHILKHAHLLSRAQRLIHVWVQEHLVVYLVAHIVASVH